MAILALFKADNITKEMYESIRKEVDWEHKHPTGVILHAAAFENSGNTIHVADVWESEQDLNNFISSRLMPVIEKVKAPQPSVEVFQINDVSAFPGIDRYKV
ncbi:MAG: hypothetical protein M3297_08210 [Thermoproteota archaeon]|jgi:hypothetical protein|nr:hypothetical protein [Thermoproteota archaeon]